VRLRELRSDRVRSATTSATGLRGCRLHAHHSVLADCFAFGLAPSLPLGLCQADNVVAQLRLKVPLPSLQCSSAAPCLEENKLGGDNA
jgi:hypothetical protein